MMKTVLDEMSWTEFHEKMAVNDLIVFPVGSTEAHGQHNPLGTDYMIADAASREIAKRLDAVMCPTLPIGHAEYLMPFSGTINLPPEVLKDTLLNICENLINHGARRFLFINGHGGNAAMIKMVSFDLFFKHRVISSQTEWWLVLPKISEFECNDHGSKFETSLMLKINDKIVDMSKAETLPRKDFTDAIKCTPYGIKMNGVYVKIGFSVDQMTPLSNYGPPAKEATKEMGYDMFEKYVEYCVNLGHELRKVRIKSVN